MKISRKFSDEELIRSLQSGQNRNEATRFIYQHFFDGLSWYILNNRGSLQDAEDIFQEVTVNFISLVQLNKFRGESSVKTFLFSLNKYTWLNELKRRGRAMVRAEKYESEKDTDEKDVSHFLV